MPNIGSNRFEAVAVPLIVGDRCFLCDAGPDGRDMWSVFTVRDAACVVEVLRNEPQANPHSTVATNPTGVVTVTDPATGRFAYKLRPGTRDSSVFGTVAGEEVEVRIKDHEITWGRGNSVSRSEVVGCEVGLMFRGDGFTMGARLPSEFRPFVTFTARP